MSSSEDRSRVLVVARGEPATADLPEQRLREAGFQLEWADATSVSTRLAQAGGAFDAIVIGPDVENAIAAARQIRTTWPHGPILFAASPQALDKLKYALSRAPLIGTNWSLVESHARNLPERLQEAILSNRRRNQLRAVLNKVNQERTQSHTLDKSDYQRLLLQVENLAQEKARQQRLYEAVLSSTSDQSYIYSLDKRLIYANQAAAEQLEIPLDQLPGRVIDELCFSTEVVTSLSEHLDTVIRTRRPVRAEMPFTSPSGRERVFEYILSPVLDGQNQLEAIAETTRDITERKKASERVWREANYDALTGLPNRRLFRDRLNQEIRHAHRNGWPLALFFIDLDLFKQVNDLHGHDAGDELLSQVAKRISSCVRETDTVARLGGDEFTVILTELGDKSHIENTARKILNELARPFQLSQATVHVSGSIGITLYPTDTTRAANLIRNADQAMYMAKNSGRSQFRFFTRSLQDAALRRLQLIDDLRSALLQNQIELYFQPIVNLRDGRIHKAEALMRWRHPTRGMLSPAIFIPLAEESGQIRQLGTWVFKRAAEYCRSWSEELGYSFQISLNKSPLQFINDNHQNWIRHLNHLGLQRHSVTVEITEGVLLNPSPTVHASLKAFQEAGIDLAIDDFGTGYASMAYLQKYHVDFLKIDQSFVRDMTSNRNSRTIVEGVIAMAHKLGLQVIAEGIETPEQRDTLQAIGCDYGQGFLFSKPLPVNNFQQLIGLSEPVQMQ